MSRRFLPIVTLSLWSVGVLLFSSVAKAEIKLTSATIRDLRNQVELQPRGQRWRGASKGNLMQPLDALKTAGKSWAELRFNDRSLARIGERALFQFLPDTRTFDLRNGTALLLIPPKQGRTRVQTPNAVAGIRGSALFVRYNPDTDTTIVGALTNSEIEVAQNKEGTQAVTLKAGQMAVLIQDRIFQIYEFDLKSFYQTSEMVRDLDLPRQKSAPSSDEAIAAVQAETAEALKSQAPLPNKGVVVNPPFVAYTPAAENSTNVNPALQTGIDRSLVEGISPLQLNTAAELAGRKPPQSPIINITQPTDPIGAASVGSASVNNPGSGAAAAVGNPTPIISNPGVINPAGGGIGAQGRPDPEPPPVNPPTPVTPTPNTPVDRPTPVTQTTVTPTPPAPVNNPPVSNPPVSNPPAAQAPYQAQPLPVPNSTPVVTPPTTTPTQPTPSTTPTTPTQTTPAVNRPTPLSSISLPQTAVSRTNPTPTLPTVSPPPAISSTVTTPPITVTTPAVVSPSITVTTPAVATPSITVTTPPAAAVATPSITVTPSPITATTPASVTTPTVAPAAPTLTPAAATPPTPSSVITAPLSGAAPIVNSVTTPSPLSTEQAVPANTLGKQQEPTTPSPTPAVAPTTTPTSTAAPTPSPTAAPTSTGVTR